MSAFKNDSAAKILDILFVCLLFGLFCLEESPGIDTQCWSSSPAFLHSSTHGCRSPANTTLVPQKTQQMLQDSWWICLIFLGQLSDGGGWKMHLYMQNMSGATQLPRPFRASLHPTGTVRWFYGAELTHGESIHNAEITQKTKYWTREGWRRCWACPFPCLWHFFWAPGRWRGLCEWGLVLLGNVVPFNGDQVFLVSILELLQLL